MRCVNRSASAAFPPELQPCSRQTVGLFAQARGRGNEKKRVVPLITTARWQMCDLVGRCYRFVAHVKLICVPILKPASSDLWQTSRFARLKKSWQPAVRTNPKRHSPSRLLRAPLASVFSALLLFSSFYGVTWSRVCCFHRRRSCLVGSDLHLFPLSFLFLEFQKVGNRGGGREEEWGRCWVITHQSMRCIKIDLLVLCVYFRFFMKETWQFQTSGTVSH